MAQRKPGKVAAPVKQKLRKQHGPKRHMFKDYKPMVHAFAQAGILSKYYNYESFAQACAARGIRTGIELMWDEFTRLPHNEKNIYLKNAQANATAAIRREENRKAKAAKKLTQAK